MAADAANLEARVATLEAQISTITGGITARLDVVESGGQGIQQELRDLRERLEKVIGEDRQRIGNIEANMAQGSGETRFVKEFKPMLESKIIHALDRLGSDRTKYENWKERLENAMESTRPGMQAFLRHAL